MQRPFISKSFVELEEIFKKAARDRDAEYLKLLDHELSFRNKNQKTPDLRTNVASALAKAPLKQQDLFGDAKQSKSARRPGGKSGTVHTKPSSRKKPKFKPTDEQAAALDAFLQGKSLKINAFAGSGKTSTLQLLANATGLRGQYIAFNKSIVSDAGDCDRMASGLSVDYNLKVDVAVVALPSLGDLTFLGQSFQDTCPDPGGSNGSSSF
ncbi:hypothetical protein [Rhizobium ruizarguesonis]|uniref:hypothetical protein n=1 Tax=Rhizobium ruizarguesonis TaxID=2081791 RepID=UPI001030F244|nr:hypothetical protein [Rhizobium ruizarguesonis]TAT71080.1 hypothetical protein ELI52_36585 [Rhizobium ruizarguesonis]